LSVTSISIRIQTRHNNPSPL